MQNTNELEQDRRSFLKTMGAGAAALGALSITPSLNAVDLPRDANGNVIPGFGEEDAHTRNRAETAPPEVRHGQPKSLDSQANVLLMSCRDPAPTALQAVGVGLLVGAHLLDASGCQHDYLLVWRNRIWGCRSWP